eukprot:1387773-Amphidinium_carterae.1
MFCECESTPLSSVLVRSMWALELVAPQDDEEGRSMPTPCSSSSYSRFPLLLVGHSTVCLITWIKMKLDAASILVSCMLQLEWAAIS